MEISKYVLVNYTIALPCKLCKGRDFEVNYDIEGWHWEQAKCKACGLVQDVRPPK